MNKINELMNKIEELKTSKKLVADEAAQLKKDNDINSIESEIKRLQTNLSNTIDVGKVERGKLVSIITSVICLIGTYIIYICTFGTLKGVLETCVGLTLCAITGGAISYMETFRHKYNQNKKRLSDDELRIQNEINDKEKQKEQIIQNKEIVEQKLFDLNNKQEVIDLAIKNNEQKLFKCEAIIRQEIEKYVYSSEFLNRVETEVFIEEDKITNGNQKKKN